MMFKKAKVDAKEGRSQRHVGQPTFDEKTLMKMITAEDPGRVANMVKRMLAA